jgi:putative ATPase
MDDLFSSTPSASSSGARQPRKPLAERMRPVSLDEVIGQDHLLGENSFLRKALRLPALPSLILWGPPGTGKTTLAKLLAEAHGDVFLAVSAVLSGVKELREAIEEAKRQVRLGKQTTVFVDEIHRFNKAQQDALLPHVEQGLITLIGATTENPSFEVNAALLSRSRVLQLKMLSEEAVGAILQRALVDETRGLGRSPATLSEAGLQALTQLSSGDARRALNALEIAAAAVEDGQVVGREEVESAFQSRAAYHDAAGDLHFDLASALIKSMRGSDPDAALYYLARMIDGGESAMFIARRLVIFASEDVGNADPMGLLVALGAKDAVHFVGFPEARISLAQAVTYLASTHKSNAAYMGINKALADVQRLPQYSIPMHLRNAPTKVMKDLGYHAGYVYPHDQPDSFVPDAVYLPDEMAGTRYYEPRDVGREGQFKERLLRLHGMRPGKGKKPKG